jgi:hypothetical protein
MINKELDNFINILLNNKFTFEKETYYYKYFTKNLGVNLYIRLQVDKTKNEYCIILKHKFEKNLDKAIIDLSLNRNFTVINRDIKNIKKFISLYNKIYD